ncbi:FAD-binding domain-containing protein [Thermosynechococcaceae cyanobacterium BACA0444]|uniref:FAD-binding domain-containing protein n=1 Tax=Pseudocalidococcus azoricus BACA0444 TaxID=2918990 RepID=A0AAE4FW25_9CYAN|nr:FAD-binding domain-containing protein [Pseudocalidococcus azoricus]MDS3862337.1 FAD-binding domain-containing protein [Pseudocalidococcus azoricus BACA0444]
MTHSAAQAWLLEFLSARLPQFGPYEDALPSRSPFVFHSVLSPLLNLGLLTPQQVLTATLDFIAGHPVPLNSLEGFIRQIIGWREYVRGAYWAVGSQQETSNFFNHQRQLSGAWQTGTTGLVPVDRVIEGLKLRGYAHHIERLMVISNAMLLCEIAPNAVFTWFMAWFVDSADWVMGPNVYGMGQFADGGRMMTKPYISGSNYLRKMGDYPTGAWQEVWDGLYWRFVDAKRDYLAQNPRLLTMLRTFDRLELTRKQRILGLAEQAIANLTV